MSDEEDADRRTVELHDRTFQRYSIENRIYYIPVDEDEELRLEAQHRVFQRVWSGRLFFPPIEYPRRILDLGYGLGDWATTVAETYEDSEVTGVDIWPADLANEPDNLELETRDLNHSLTRWARRDHYDLVHSRCVGPGIQRDRWRSYVRDIHRVLRRGGWAELSEWSYFIQSDSGRMTENNMVYQWTRAYRSTMEQDRNPRIASQLAGLLNDAGFTDVNSRVVNVPVGEWHDLPHMQDLGRENREQLNLMLDSHAILPFTTRLQPQWTPDDVKRLTDGARAEMLDDSLKLYMPLYGPYPRLGISGSADVWKIYSLGPEAPLNLPGQRRHLSSHTSEPIVGALLSCTTAMVERVIARVIHGVGTQKIKLHRRRNKGPRVFSGSQIRIDNAKRTERRLAREDQERTLSLNSSKVVNEQ